MVFKKLLALPSVWAAQALFKYTYVQSPKRFWVAITVLSLGLALEGFSIFLLLPLMGFLAGTKPDLNAPIEMTILKQLGIPSVEMYLHELLILFVILVTCAGALNRVKTLFVATVVLDTANNLRTELFYSISKTRWDFISRKRKADLDHLLNGDIERMQGSLSAAFSVIQNFAALAIYTAISVVISPLVTTAAVFSGLLIFGLSSRIRRISFSFGELYSETRRTQHRFTMDFLNGLKSIKSYSAEYVFRNAARNSFAEGKNAFKQYASQASLSSLIIQTLNLSAATTIIYISLIYANLQIEYVLFLFVIFLRINPRFSSLQVNVQQMLTDAPSFLQMRRTLDECSKHADSEPPAMRDAISSYEGDISLRGISYEIDGEIILHDVSVNIKRNDITVLHGPSGSGKTTLADVIMGLIEPQYGVMHIGNLQLTRQLFTSWRNHIAYVPQQSFVLAGSIRENLIFGGAHITSDRLEYALRLSNSQEIVDRLPHGLDTQIGDGGVQLSGGELQRLSLARALARNPSLLVLDEVTSGLDTTNRDLILEALLSLNGRVTIIMISHDNEIIRRAPNSIRLENGYVINQSQIA